MPGVDLWRLIASIPIPCLPSCLGKSLPKRETRQKDVNHRTLSPVYNEKEWPARMKHDGDQLQIPPLSQLPNRHEITEASRSHRRQLVYVRFLDCLCTFSANPLRQLSCLDFSCSGCMAPWGAIAEDAVDRVTVLLRKVKLEVSATLHWQKHLWQSTDSNEECSFHVMREVVGNV